jgi:hypothetical protein
MNDLVPPKGTMSLTPDDLSAAAEAVEATRIAADVESANDAEATPEEPVINEQQAAMLMQTFAEEQNLLMGTLSGLLAALLGAGIWAAVTVTTEYQIGWMAVGIGFLVGFTMRYAGKGITPVFGTVSAVLSLVGCLVGNVVTYTWFIADMEGMTFMEVASQLNLAVVIGLLTSTFAVMDILFYGLAAYFGYKYAFRQVTQADIDRVMGKSF